MILRFKFNLQHEIRLRCYVLINLLFVFSNSLIASWKYAAIDASGYGADGVNLYTHEGEDYFSVAWEQTGESRVYKSTDGDIDLISSFVTPSVEECIISDLDNDGCLEIVSFQEIPANRITINSINEHSTIFDGTALRCSEGVSWMCGEVFDFNKDGMQDIVAGSKGENASISLFISDSSNSSFTKIDLTECAWIMSLQLVDIDRDGLKDILFSDRRGSNSGIYWIKNSGVFDEGKVYEKKLIGLHRMEPMFLNVYVKNSKFYIYASEILNGFYRYTFLGNNTWKEEHLFGLPRECGDWAKDILPIDLDNDGELEIVTAYNNAYHKYGVIYSEYLNGNWKHYPISDKNGPKYDLILPYDYDGDGDYDILNTEENDNSVHKPGLGFIWFENPLI